MQQPNHSCNGFNDFGDKLCHIDAYKHIFKLRTNRIQTKTSLFLLLYRTCSFSHHCSIESSFVHIAKKLRLEKFIAATQSMTAKNDTGFTKDAFNVSRTSRSN